MLCSTVEDCTAWVRQNAYSFNYCKSFTFCVTLIQCCLVEDGRSACKVPHRPSQSLPIVRKPLFPAVLPDFPAKFTIFFRKPECAHFGRFISRYGGYNSAVEAAMTRPVHVRFLGGRRFSTQCTTWLPRICQQFSTDSSGAFSVGGHAHAHILGPARSQDCSDWI